MWYQPSAALKQRASAVAHPPERLPAEPSRSMLDALRPAAAAAALAAAGLPAAVAAPGLPQRLAALGALSDALLRGDPDLAATLSSDADDGGGGVAAGMAASDRRFGLELAALLV